MARLVKRTATGPYRIEVGAETKVICGCGLSKNQPFCDGTHKTTARTEDADKLYWDDAEGNRHECADAYPGIRTP
jgi:CDGSH iron-sulfur domain-containing protein 3